MGSKGQRAKSGRGSRASRRRATNEYRVFIVQEPHEPGGALPMIVGAKPPTTWAAARAYAKAFNREQELRRRGGRSLPERLTARVERLASEKKSNRVLESGFK